ncbi:MAG: YkgJ family cysteine cluster protein [Myxococcales bacterium]|nr:YkgJ family cysteine cluster protein [Myxococcota bacterium]MDW8281044.1 YkgJ family cysteine cluster protein [Myxococcales bacterium]
MVDLLAEYRALRDKVDRFATEVTEHRRADLACRRGCSDCCRVELSLCPVEAEAVRQALGALSAPQRAGLAAFQGACACLLPDGACAIYAHRPLVCRTQGLPLHYPEQLVPAAALRAAATAARAFVCCPRNFTMREPDPADILDAQRVDVLLAVVNRRFAAQTGQDPLLRVPLRALVAEAREAPEHEACSPQVQVHAAP